MKKFVIYGSTLIVILFGFTVIKNYPSYKRVTQLYQWQAENALNLEVLIKNYYQHNLSFPSRKEQLDQFIIEAGFDDLMESFLNSNYKISITDTNIFIYDLGFDNIDDSLKQLCPKNEPSYIKSLFSNGDFLIYKENFKDVNRLLIGNYFVYDSNRTALTNQSQYEGFFEIMRKDFLTSYYADNYSIQLDELMFKPGKDPDTLLVRGEYVDNNWEITVINHLKEQKFDFSSYKSLLTQAKSEKPEINSFYLTVPLALDGSKIYLPQ